MGNADGEPSVGRPTAAFVRDLERRRLASLVTPDIGLAMDLHADDYQLVTPGGATYTRDEYVSGIASGDLRYTTFEPDGSIEVRLFADGAAVRYVARIVIAFPGGHDDGRFWHTDIYRYRDGRWQATWSQATQIPSG